MKKKQLRSEFASTLKSPDTEEFIDIYFYRPIGYLWALLFKKLGIYPNTVTVIAMLIGAAAGVCFYFTDLWINFMGILLLIWANSYDSADGQLARMTGHMSPVGRMLDGFCGNVWFVCIYTAICLRLMPEWSLWIWVLGGLAGFFHGKQAAMADYYRNIHLFFLKGASNSELADSQTLYAQYKHKQRTDGFFIKLSDYLYYDYTKGQEALAQQFVRMRETLKRKYTDGAPEWFRDAFRAKSLPLMKYTNMLSFNTRVIVLCISLVINIPWIYFVFELTVLNVMLAYMIYRHESICKLFNKQLEEGII